MPFAESYGGQIMDPAPLRFAHHEWLSQATILSTKARESSLKLGLGKRIWAYGAEEGT